jgi:hypothetical protein
MFELKNANRCMSSSSSSEQGASGVGLGNFLEVGPLDVNLKPRDSTWLQKADLIFVVSDRDRRTRGGILLSCSVSATYMS